MLATVALAGVDIYDRHNYVSSVAVPAEDLRLAPFKKENTNFFSKLPVDPKESVMMVCYPYDPMSCNIAALYRDRFADHWSPVNTRILAINPAPFKGIAIITHSENERPAGALALREQFRQVGIDPAFPWTRRNSSQTSSPSLSGANLKWELQLHRLAGVVCGPLKRPAISTLQHPAIAVPPPLVGRATRGAL